MGSAVSYKQLSEAVEGGDIDIVQKARDSACTDKHRINYSTDINTLLYRAVLLSHSEIVRLLTEMPEVNVNIGVATETPLHASVRLGDVLSCDHLLRAQASPDLVSPQGHYTALYTAVATQQTPLVRMLLKAGANPNAHTDKIECKNTKRKRDINEGTTPIQRAITDHTAQICDLLCQANADVNIPDSYGRTAVHLAVREGSLTLTRLCLLYQGRVNVTDNDQTTPLHIAVKYGNPELINLILNEQDCDVNVQRRGYNAEGNTALHDAIEADNQRVVQTLCQHGADLNRQTTYGKTPLILASELGQLENVKTMLRPENRKALNSKHLDLNLQDHTGSTILINAIKRKNNEMCKTVISSAIRNTKNSHTDQTEHSWTLPLDVNLFDHHGQMALHHAADKGLSFVCELLLSNGACYNHRDRHACMPLQYCLSGGHTLAAFILLRHGHTIPENECEVVQMIQMATLPRHSSVLQLLVYLGWRPHTVGVQQLTSFLARCVGSNPSGLISWMAREAREPLSLQRLSRLPAREFIARSHGYRSIVEVVMRMNVSNGVKETLLLDDIKTTWSFKEQEIDLEDDLVLTRGVL